MKSQKGGERKANEVEANEHESSWRLLVFGMPHGEEFRFLTVS